MLFSTGGAAIKAAQLTGWQIASFRSGVAALALLLDRALEKKLRAAHSRLSSPAAWQALETVRCVEMQVGERTKLCVTRGSRQAGEVLKILHLTDVDPPEPPEGNRRAVW